MTITPLAVFAAAVILAAMAWHGVHSHSRHLRILRVFRPQTAVPPIRYDTWWHGLGAGQRIAFGAALPAGGACTGLAWVLAPAAATAAVIAVLAGTAVARTIRSRLDRRGR